MGKKAVYLFKRDFRLEDNPALTTALLENDKIIAFFVLEKEFLIAAETSIFHVIAIRNAYIALKNAIENKGGCIHLVCGSMIDTLDEIKATFNFTRIYAHEEVGNNRTYERDRAIHKWSEKHHVLFNEYPQTGVFRRLNDRDKRNKLWKKFTFAPLLPQPRGLEKFVSLPWDFQDEFPDLEMLVDKYPNLINHVSSEYRIQSVCESAANETLTSFIEERALGYSKAISSPNSAFEKGSRLSVHLAWGTISGRRVYQTVLEAIEKYKKKKDNGDLKAGKMASSLRAFLSRLHWRDHFIQRLETETDMEYRALNPAYENLEYENDPKLIEAFFTGRTGFPMVDACVRCLRETGFVNFRMRAMLTSFACHTLHIDWRKIDAPMANWYTDYEPGIHLSQLQMQAGVVGINTLRTYSPTKQLTDHDPDAEFVKQFIPELRAYDAKTILAHGDEPLGDYPPHIVDWKSSSGEMRRRVYAIRRTDEYKAVAEEVYQKHGSRRRTQNNSPKKRQKNN